MRDVSRLPGAIMDVVRDARHTARPNLLGKTWGNSSCRRLRRDEFGKGGVIMRFTKLGALAVIALSLISTDTLAFGVNRKFNPVVNDDPQNSHLNVQTPGADSNQAVVIQEEPGPDGQVIPAGDSKVASCAVKDVNGDIDLSGGDSCWSPKASGPIAERAPVASSTIGQAPSPSPRTASQTIRVPGLMSASGARAGNSNATRSAPSRSGHAFEAARVAAPLPAHRSENARAAALGLPGKQPAPAARADVTDYEFARTQWLLIGGAAALLLLAVGLGILSRMGMGNLLLIHRHAGRRTSEESAARDGQVAVSDAVDETHQPVPVATGS